MVGDFEAPTHSYPQKKIAPRPKVWKQRNLANQMKLSNVLEALIQRIKLWTKIIKH